MKIEKFFHVFFPFENWFKVSTGLYPIELIFLHIFTLILLL